MVIDVVDFVGDSLVIIGLSVCSLFLFIIVLLICLFRSRSHYTLDESSELLSSSSGTDFSSYAANYDHAYMCCQYYVRELTRLEYHQSFKTPGDHHSFWFSVKDKDLAKNKNRGRFIPSASGSCVLKIQRRPKLSLYIKNDPEKVLDILLDMLLTIKEESCPYIFPFFDLRYYHDRDTLLLLSEYVPHGSLRDQMLGMKPFYRFNKPSAKAKKIDYGKPLSTEKICMYTKQILMALIFLDKLRFPLKKTHLWLHAGNLIMENGICKLSGYEVELLQLKDRKTTNAERAGLTSVGQIVFEMATGFPVNYADETNLDPSKNKLTLSRKDKLQDVHFEYLKMISEPEIVQLVQFLCDDVKCASLHVSIHHPFFDQVTKFQPFEPENGTIVTLKTLWNTMARGRRSSKPRSLDQRFSDGEANLLSESGSSRV